MPPDIFSKIDVYTLQNRALLIVSLFRYRSPGANHTVDIPALFSRLHRSRPRHITEQDTPLISTYAYVLVANQTSILRNGLREIINNEDDFVFVGDVDHGYKAQRHCLQAQPHVAIVDSSLPGPPLSALVDNLSTSCPKINILILADTADNVDIQTLIEKGISGCILQSEPDVLIAHAIRTVGLGASWFSKCFMVKLLQQKSDRPRNTGKEYGLSDRELEVAKSVAEGLSNRQIGYALGIKERTIEFHMTNIFQKLHMDNRVAVAMWARDFIL